MKVFEIKPENYEYSSGWKKVIRDGGNYAAETGFNANTTRTLDQKKKFHSDSAFTTRMKKSFNVLT